MADISFLNNEECALELYNYLVKVGEIEASAYNFESIVHDINNLRGNEWLRGLERSTQTKRFFDYIGLEEFEDVGFIFNQAISPNLFLKLALDKDFPEDISFEQFRTILDQNGLEELWDYSEEDLDEALSNNDYLFAVSFYEPSGYFARICEATEGMSSRFYDEGLENRAKRKTFIENVKKSSLSELIEVASARSPQLPPEPSVHHLKQER